MRDAYKLDELATRLLASDALTPNARAEIAEMRAEALKDKAPDRRPRRAPGWWALGLTAAASLAIGRATVPRDQPDPLSLRTVPTIDMADEPALPASDAAEWRAIPSLVNALAATVKDNAPAVNVKDGPSPAALPPARAATKPGPITPASRAPRREAVTVTEAKEAAQDAVPGLRTCDGVPSTITADLEIVGGRGVVKALNSHAVAPDDPLYRWHGCVRRTLEGVDFPKAETAGHARVRLTLR